MKNAFAVAAFLLVLTCAARPQAVAQAAMDRDLMEINIPRLHELYRQHRYTVTQVVNWYIARVRRYNGVYGAVEFLDAKGALETAAREDAQAATSDFNPGLLW